MERNSMNMSNNNSLKDQRIGYKFTRHSNNNEMKDSWNYSNSNSQQQQSFYGEEYLSGFSWPPRSYTCSFCKREFRSAQALGGHMNVHRRDRARLRMSPPPPRDNNNNNNDNNGQYPFLNLNLNPNPSPNPNFISTPPLVSPISTSFSCQSLASPSEMNKWGINGTLSDALSLKDSVKKSSKSFTGVEELEGCKLTKKAEIVRLDLEIGLISSDSKEDLDLELRLGYS